MNKFKKLCRFILMLALSLRLGIAALPEVLAIDDTTPAVMLYEGVLKDSSGNAITRSHTLRFSFWSSADWVIDDRSGGMINTSAPNYAGWQEVQTVTPDSSGVFSLKLGSITALPVIDFDQHKFLQVEVKASGTPNTSYELMDPTGDAGMDTVDRSTIASLPYSKNTERLDNKEIGTNAGDIALLGQSGQWAPSQIPGGTTADAFILDNDNSIEDAGTGSIGLQFGNTLNKVLAYDFAADQFELNDDLDVQGNLSISGALQFTDDDGEITYDSDNDTFDLDANRLTNVADPVSHQDVATKNYVDNFVNGANWQNPVEHPDQLVGGSSGGIRGGGKIFVSDETLVNADDTISFSYNSSSSSFVLTAKDDPTAANCEFKSGTAATDNLDLATSILAAINACTNAADFAGNSLSDQSSVFIIHDVIGTPGNGAITLSGSGLVKINMHEGKTRANLLESETRLSRNNDSIYNWNSTSEQWVATSSGSIPDATTTTKGKVQLATDGESVSGEVVQASDSRLHNANTDTGTTQTSFTVNSSASQLILDSTGLTSNRTITFDDANTKVVGEDNLQTLTNKTIDAQSNTLQNISWDSLSTRDKNITLIPAYPGLTIEEDGSNNTVTLKLDTNTSDNHNYYVLSSAQPNIQDLDLVIKLKLPDDFVSWQATPLQLYIKSDSGDIADNRINVFVDDTNNNSVSLSGAANLVSSVAGVWSLKSVTFTGAPVWTAGNYFTVRLKMQAKNNNEIRLGEIKLNYVGR